jgi:hypothetical protein
MTNRLNLTQSRLHARQLRGEAETWQLAHTGGAAEDGIRRPLPRSLAIRAARADDAVALKRLAQLEGRRQPTLLSRVLVAEVGGELVAALPLDGGEAIADPFRQTAQLVAILKLQAGQLRLDGPRVGLRARLRRLLGPAAGTPVAPVTPGRAPMLAQRDC